MVPASRVLPFARALYLGQQLSLAALFGFVMRAVQTVLDPKHPYPRRDELEVLVRRYRALLEADLAYAAQGDYPRELLFQFPLVHYARALPTLLIDAPLYVDRWFRRRYDELPPEVDRRNYPRYYLRNFHGQTDGWFSEHSASIYDLQVELLFGGTADVMRRMAIPPVAAAIRRDRKRSSPARILDVACGTGRFLSQLRRALPDALLHGIDLSPAYVARARRLHEKTGVRFLAGNAESLPFPDASFDAVTSIFLFHELPSDARRNVVREAMRVLAPGGALVIVDSAQSAESRELGFFLDHFSDMYHEPYFKGYLRDDLGALVANAGFVDVEARPFFVSRRVAARKPG